MPQNHDSDDVLLPPWADRLAHGDYRIIGAMLPTRDGRKLGNATILRWETPSDGDFPFARILTDAGTECRFVERELRDLFWPPTWVRKPTGADSATHGRDHFEIGTEKMVENGDDQGQAILSIAANLKRIADMGPSLGEVGWHLKRIADVVDPVDKSSGDFFQRADIWFQHWLGAWIRSR